MCPEPALLAAYLDGTLFAADAVQIERHTAGCTRCAALLVSMRHQRALARPKRRWPRPGAVVAVVVLVAAGLGAWGLLLGLPGSGGGSDGGETVESAPVAAGEEAPPQPPTPEAGPVLPAPVQTVPDPPVPVPGAPAPPDESGLAVAAPAPVPVPVPETAPPTPVDVPAVPDESGDGLLLRRRPGARVVLRVRARTIERSTDAGSSWEVEYTADRPVRAGTFVDAEVAWLVGEDGLVLRRTPNGWFGTNPPAAGHVDAVRASSTIHATVTLADGRVLVTDNGGITWSEP